MSDTVGARRLPFRALGRIGVAPGNAAARHAAHWLRLLGGGEPATAATADIVIAGTGLDSDHREPECLIRLWDFQVGRPGGGVLASAVSGASAVIGRADGLPLPLPAEMPEKWCGLYGVILALAELWRRPVPGVAPRVVHDVSAADVIRAFALQNSGGPEEMRRSWRRNGRLCVEHGGIFPMGFFACRDGHVAILGRSRRDWRNIREAIGDPEWARGPEFEDPFAIARNSAEADRLLEASLAAFGRDELLERGLESGAVIAPVYDREEASARGVFRDGFLGEDGPELPFLVETAEATGRIAPRQGVGTPDRPLAGLRCIELAWIWSGPMVGQILADLGAEVIKVEAPNRFDLYRTRGLEAMRGRMDERSRIESSLYFHSLNRNKIGLALDLKKPQGVEVLTRLAARSELVLENFTVGTMARLGLGPEVLWASNPGLCQLSMSGPGRGSAVERLRAYGLVLSALAGAEIEIRDGEEFLGSPTFSLSDPNAAAFGAVAALAGILAAREDGRGRAVDLSQIEAAATLAGTARRGEDRIATIVCADDGGCLAVDLPANGHGDTEMARAALDGRSRAEIEARVVALGGESAEVLALEDTDAAPEFADCSGWIAATHPYSGEEMLVAAPWRVDGRRPGLRKPAPLLGEGDDYVLRRVLALDDAEIEALVAGAVVGVGERAVRPKETRG